MDQNGTNLSHLKHDLRTYLNHIVGYGDILIADAKEYNREEFIPGIDQILKKADQIKRLIHFHFDSAEKVESLNNVQEIRKAMFLPLVQLIGDSRKMLALFRNKSPQFARDIEQLLTEANQMHELVESELSDLEMFHKCNSSETFKINLIREQRCYKNFEEDDFPSLSETPISLKIASDETIEGQLAKIPAKVLVIDDNLSYHRLIRYHLEALGHTVFCMNDGASAIRFLAESPVDIIILDVLMPGMPGSNLLKLLKQDKVFAGIPVIMMSALADSANIAQCIRLGAEDYLPKDFDPIILKARIDACMEKKLLQQQQDIYMQALLESQAALATELSDAASYVVKLLPPPLQEDIKACVTLIPSAQLGGDFCAFHWVDEDNLALYLMDVSGHGVKSSLLAVSISNIITNQAIPGVDFLKPSEVMAGINKVFKKDDHQSLYFCLWYGIYNKTTRTLSYASGGSPPACIIRAQNPEQVEELVTGDLVLGAVEDYVYDTNTLTINPGDKLYIYSDGLYEICKPNNKCLGLKEFQNLLPLLNQNPSQNSEHLVQSILSLTKNENFQDDVSLIAAEF